MAAVKGAKNRRVAQIQEAEVLNSVKEVSFDTVTNELATVQVEVQRTLADLSGKLTAQLGILDDVQKAIALKREELKQLHQIEVTATTLDELQAQIKDTQTQFEEERAQWKRNFAEQQSEARKAWAREEADYKYTTEQKHRKHEDTMQLAFEQKEKANRDKQEQLEKNWLERETNLKKAEQELAELRAFKEAYPEMVKKAINQDVAIASNSIKKEYEHKAQIAQKDAEMEKRLADAQALSDRQTIEKMQVQIVDLKEQITNAHQRVADISTKALDSASGRATTEALQRMMETEKMSGKTTK
jgi:chromosome segregation ATPase